MCNRTRTGPPEECCQQVIDLLLLALVNLGQNYAAVTCGLILFDGYVLLEVRYEYVVPRTGRGRASIITVVFAENRAKYDRRMAAEWIRYRVI